MAAVNADPEVMRWIHDGGVRDEQQTRDGIRAWESEWEARGFGLFAVEIRSTGEPAGFTGLSVPYFLPGVLPAVEVGWRLGRSHRGRGLATEAAAATVRFGFEERGLGRIVSIAQVGNDASERVMAEPGMHPVRETVSPACDRERGGCSSCRRTRRGRRPRGGPRFPPHPAACARAGDGWRGRGRGTSSGRPRWKTATARPGPS